jgi:hypothetical protein
MLVELRDVVAVELYRISTRSDDAERDMPIGGDFRRNDP